MLQEGGESMPLCDMCRMHILEGRLINHRISKRCFNNIEMMPRRKDVEVSSQCEDMEFNLTEKDVEETIEEEARFT